MYNISSIFPVWVFLWFFRIPIVVKDLPHSSQVTAGCCSVFSWCVFLWEYNSLLLLNAFWHISHGNGLSPVCILLCLIHSPFRENPLLHTSHEKGILSRLKCVNLWAFKVLRSLNVWWHSSHEKGFSPVCRVLCTFNLSFVVNSFLQTSHEWGKSDKRS